MKYFLIKAYKGAKDDPFMMKGGEEFLLFAAFGLADLEQTLKGILPQGYRVSSKATLSKYLRRYGGFQKRSLFNVPVAEVIEVGEKPQIEQELDFYNKSRRSYFNIKKVESDLWESVPDKPEYEN